MKYPARVFGIIILGLALAFPAQAALLGSADGSDISSATSTLPVGVYTINQGAPTSLNTTLTGTTTSLVRRYSNKFYFTSAAGLQRQAGGGTTSTTVRSGKNLNLIASRGDLLVVGSPKMSFVYDLKQGKATAFKPTVGAVASADLSGDGKVLVVIAKNAKGKSKLFLSQGNAATVKEFSLPKGASSCTEVSVSPAGTLAALQCVFDTTVAVVIVNVNGQTVGAMNKKTIATFSPVTADWLNGTNLLVGGLSLNPVTLLKEEYRSYAVKGGKVVSTEKLAIDNSALIPAGATLSTPAQILRLPKSKFYYAYLSLAVSTVDPTHSALSTVVGLYDLATDTNTVLVNDGRYNTLTEAPTVRQ